MRMLQVVLLLALFGDEEQDDESQIVDALLPENIVCLISQLNDDRFETRDQVAKTLVEMGQSAVYPLAYAADNGSPEVSVRSFDLLQQLFRSNHDQTFELVEGSLQELRHSNNLSVAARAQQTIDNNTEMRQERTIQQIERLGGIVSFRDRGIDRQPLPRPVIEYIALAQDWVGGDNGLKLLGRIEDVRSSDAKLYLIRGVHVSEESVQNLRAELPFLDIQYRGPARLGVRSIGSQRDEDGCAIAEVDPGSAAEVAGLRMNDVIIEIEGQPVGNFQRLIQIIESKEPGNHVPIVFRRGVELHQVDAELQTWTRIPRPADAEPQTWTRIPRLGETKTKSK